MCDGIKLFAQSQMLPPGFLLFGKRTDGGIGIVLFQPFWKMIRNRRRDRVICGAVQNRNRVLIECKILFREKLLQLIFQDDLMKGRRVQAWKMNIDPGVPLLKRPGKFMDQVRNIGIAAFRIRQKRN